MKVFHVFWGMFTVCMLSGSASLAETAARPNLVWLVVEDMSANMGCYGEAGIATPNIDALAASGLRFERAFVTGPICSICRSALITGMYQTSIGAHHHRSGRGPLAIQLPEPVRPAAELFREAGYLTLNLTVEEFARSDAAVKKNAQVRTAKTDYNFQWNPQMYDSTHWAVRREGQPFFVQVQMHGGKYRGKGDTPRWPEKVIQTLGSRTLPDSVRLPPYLPDDPVIREDWAQYLDTVRYTDWEVGRIVARLQEAGELDRTYIFFITDHGVSHVRNKQFLYEGGMHIPLIVRGPGIKPASVRTDPVLQIDLAASSLALAGISVPDWMQARDILARDYAPRQYVFAARDRADETVDCIRAVRSERFKYIRNYYPSRPYLQPNAYKDGKPIIQAMRRLHAEGKLSSEQALILADARPREELYDLENDPFEFYNLAESAPHQATLKTMRKALSAWQEETNDHGRAPESDAMYDSDMQAYLSKANPTVERNIATMKQWAKQRPFDR